LRPAANPGDTSVIDPTAADTLSAHLPDDEPPEGWLDHWYERWEEGLEYRPLQGSIYDHGPIQGRDAMRKHARDWLEIIDGFQMTPIEVVPAGEGHVAVLFRITGRARGSDVLIRQRIAAVYEYRDGRLVRGHEYRTLDEALQAVGLARLRE
jgi:ketosteroid isomerase-like protein